MSLDEKTKSEPVQEEFLPPSDWDHQKESDTLILMLPGFRREQLKVQVSSSRVLRLSGERKISDNKWRRFRKEEQLSDFHDTSGISAKFEAGMLYIRLPKVFKTEPPPTQEEPPKPQQPTITTDADQKEPKEDKTEETKTETEVAQTPPLQEPTKPDNNNNNNEDSQKEPQEETEAQKMHETRQTSFKELQKEDHDEDSEKKLTQSQSQKEKVKGERNGNEGREAIVTPKLAEGSVSRDDGLSTSSVAKMNKSLEMISGLVEEVKKQNKMANVVVLVFLVLLIGIYIKSLVKSSFGGPKNQEF